MESSLIQNMPDKPIIFFDGHCNLCNVAIQFIIKHDSRQTFLFSTLTGKFAMAKKIFEHQEMEPDTLALYDSGNLYIRSDAVIEIAARLDGCFKIIVYTKIFPRVVRNWVYNLIAKNRYRLFGQKAQCMIPDKAIMQRFIS